MNLMDAFNVGKQIKGKGAGNIMAEGVMEDFQTQNKYKQQLALEQAKSQMVSPVDESTIAKNNAMAQRYSGQGGGRDIFLVNRRTGKISRAGDQTMGEVNPQEVGQMDKILGVDIPPAAASQMFSQSEASIKQIDDLIGVMRPTKSDVKPANKFMGGLTGMAEPLIGTQSAQTQQYNVIRKDFSDRLLRLRSGAQINEQEYQRLMGMLPQWWRNNEVDVQQLTKFKTEYQNLMARLSGGEIGRVGNRADISDDITHPDSMDLSSMSDEELDALEKQMGR